MHVGSKTFGERQLEIFEVGEMQFTFPTSQSKITMSVLFRHIYKATAPPARVNLWVGGWLPARVGLC